MTRPVLLPALMLLTVACGKGDGDAADSAEPGGASAEDAAAAEALWTEISGYDSWNQHADWTGVKASADGTHGPYVQIWYNDSADAGFTAAGDSLDDGSILVKEGYDDESGASVRAITVMKKTGGDWFWARYSEDGSVATAGAAAVDSCAGCHAAGKDSIRFISW